MLDILIALGAGLGGVICGWLMRSSVSSQPEIAEATEAAKATEAGAPNDELTRKGVYEVAEKLRALSMRIAAEVDEHQSRVQQVNLALTDGVDVPDPDAIVNVVTELIQSNQTMQDQLQEAQQRIQEQAVQIQTAEERAMTDALTRIRNRRAFDDFLEKRYIDRHESPSTLMLLDVDHFKKFNDSFGHLAGDEVLRNVASILETRLGEMGLVARYGGEEFAVIFEDRDLQSCQGAVELARRVIGEREIMFEGQRLRVTASLGLAELDTNESLEEWVDRVDRGLYKAKDMGRDCGYCMDGAEPQRLLGPDNERGSSGERKERRVPSSLGATPPTASDEMAGREETGNAAEKQRSEGPPQPGRRLHDKESLGVVFAEMSERLKIVEVGLYVMIVRSDRTEPDSAHRQEILTSICSVTRSLGQVGALENGDFVICMPSANEQAALQRARAICDAVEQSSSRNAVASATVSIGLSLVRQEDSFECMLAAARCAVEEAAAQGANRVVIGRAVPAGDT